ncbi:MAG: hypothetical protein RIR26_1631 [Pseudomonadota bacterium]
MSTNGNCASRVWNNIAAHPDKLALWSASDGAVSFAAFGRKVVHQQRTVEELGLNAGDSVLVMATPSADLYATVVALLGSGVGVVFFEPWMPQTHVDRALQLSNVKALFADRFGQIWRLRHRGLRQLRHAAVPIAPEEGKTAGNFQLVSVDPSAAAIVSFTSGTTGVPKGVVRSHGYLWNLHELLVKYGEEEKLLGPDLTVLPNLALFHLGTGRGSILVPTQASSSVLERIFSLEKNLRPQSLSCGPAFLKQLLDNNLQLQSIRKINLGGAVIDCDLVERALTSLPHCDTKIVYGGAEVEPISLIDAKKALAHSREKGYIQILNVGEPISELKLRWDEDAILWVSGPNVCQEFIGSLEENARHKERDEHGVLWHRTGDRVLQDENGLWFMGRDDQTLEDFLNEQRIFVKLSHTRGFLRRDNNLSPMLIVDDDVTLATRAAEDVLKEKVTVWQSVMFRDRRHRSRIDRSLTWRRGLRMLRWWTYFKERSPFFILLILASGPVVSGWLLALTRNVCDLSGSFRCLPRDERWSAAALTVVSSIVFMIQARLMDEAKDLEKDQLANPKRPLPRGLLTPQEVHGGIRFLMLLLLACSSLFFVLGTPLGGFLFLAASIYLWLMFKEFYAGEALSKSPLLYALSHQIVGMPLYLLGICFFAPPMARQKDAWVFVGLNLFSSMAYEFSRKLQPDAHPAANTYRQVYGLPFASALALTFQLAALMMSWIFSDVLYGMSGLMALQAISCLALFLHAVRDGWHRATEGLAAMCLLAAGWTGLLVFLRW